MAPKEPQRIGVLDALAFLCELAMLALLVAAGHGLASGWRGWVLGVIFASVAIAIWALWMAPTSAHRLDMPARFVVQMTLFVAVAGVASAGGLLWWGAGFAVAAIATFAAPLRQEA